jgi:hypothetical protein
MDAAALTAGKGLRAFPGRGRRQLQAALRHGERINGQLFGFAAEGELEAVGQQLLQHHVHLRAGSARGFIGFGFDIVASGAHPCGTAGEARRIVGEMVGVGDRDL